MRRLAVLLAVVAVAAMLLLLRTGCDAPPLVEPLPPPPPARPLPPPPPILASSHTPIRVGSSRVRNAVANADADPATKSERTPETLPPGDGELPDDELGTGDCVLTLRLVDDATGQSIESQVRLWRRGAPGTGKWTAGDHVQRRVIVPESGLTMKKLPAGTYRVEVDAARESAEDPPEFALSDEAVQTIRVALPRALPIRCTLVDEYGRPIGTAEHREGTVGWGSTLPRRAPAWSAPRRPADGGDRPSPYSARRLAPGGESYQPMNAGGDGFELGAIPETDHFVSFTQTDEFRIEGRNSVQVVADAAGAALGGYVGVAVPLRTLLERVQLPNGYPLPSDAAVTAQCQAVPRPAGAPGDLWRTIPVRVTVTVPGYAPLAFTWTAAEPPRETLVMQPAER